MKKITLLLLLFYIKSLGQISKNMFVYDSKSNKPIPFATIMFIEDDNKQNGLYTDENGFAKVELIENAILEISCLGYESKRFSNQHSLKDTIFLNSNAIILDEVVLANKNKIKYLGFNNEKKNKSLNTFKGSEMVVYINNLDSINTKIKSVLLDIKKSKDFTVALKIKFYKKNINKNTPSDLINNQEIVYYIKEKINGTIEIDINEFNIDFPIEGAFVGVECIGFIDKNGNFIEDNSKWNDFRLILVDTPKNATFTKNNLRTNEWFNNLKSRLEEVGEKYKNFPNLALGINVYVE